MMHHQEKVAEDYPLALLYQKYARVILVYLDRRISIKEDAEDLLLEVFLAALENSVWTTLTDGEQLAWLRRVARNKLIDHYRQKTRHPATPLEEVHETLDGDENLLPEYLALRHEALAILYREIAALPKLQQEVLRLRFARGLHTKEIAQMLNKTDAAIRIVLSRTLNQLRRSYDQQHSIEESKP
jgi:RNA polymerase sigma-70 factor (ECF subfamily)